MRNEFAKQLISVIAGFLLLLHGFQAFERDEQTISIVFVILAFILFIVAGSRKWLLVRYKRTEAWFYFVQAVALFYSGYQYIVEGRRIYVIVSMLLASIYLLYSLKLFIARRKRRKKHRRQLSSR